jgi:hypothetical protein
MSCREKARECLEHAENCERIANEIEHPLAKAEYLQMARRWRALALSYDVGEDTQSRSRRKSTE